MTGTLTFVIIPKATTNSTSSASLAASAAPAATPAAPGMPGSTPGAPACPASSASTGYMANNVPCGPSMASEASTNQVNNNDAQQLRKANSVEVGEQVVSVFFVYFFVENKAKRFHGMIATLSLVTLSYN